MSGRWACVGALLVVVGCDQSQGPAVPDCSHREDDEVCSVFRLVNDKRAAAGLHAYVYNVDLAVAAQLHAEDMVEHDYFSHTSQDGTQFDQRIVDQGYDGSPRAENIAMGQTSPEQVMDSWMASPGHRANILSDSANEIGVGFHDDLWVQDFGFRK